MNKKALSFNSVPGLLLGKMRVSYFQGFQAEVQTFYVKSVYFFNIVEDKSLFILVINGINQYPMLASWIQYSFPQ